MTADPRHTEPDQAHGSDDIGLMRLSAVLAATTLSRSSFLAGVKAGLYPPPVKIGLRSVAWRRSDIAELVRDGIQTPFSKSGSASPATPIAPTRAS